MVLVRYLQRLQLHSEHLMLGSRLLLAPSLQRSLEPWVVGEQGSALGQPPSQGTLPHVC